MMKHKIFDLLPGSDNEIQNLWYLATSDNEIQNYWSLPASDSEVKDL